MGGQEALVEKVLRVFYESQPRSLTQLRDNVENADWKNLMRNAHAMKGAAAYVSAAGSLPAVMRSHMAIMPICLSTDKRNKFVLCSAVFSESCFSSTMICWTTPDVHIYQTQQNCNRPPTDLHYCHNKDMSIAN